MTANVDNPPRTASARVNWGLLVGLMLGPFLALLDLSIVTVALPSIGDQLHTGASGLQWLVDAYTVCLAALLLSGGTLGDRFGRRQAYLVGIVVFTLASAGCAAAPDIGVLIAARCVQGAAAALLMTGSLSLLVQAFPDPAVRARMLGLNGMIGGSSIVIGPVLGGVLVDSLGWRTIFLINLPVGVVAVWLVLRAVRESADPDHATLDPAGQLLSFVTLAAITYGVIESQNGGWAAPGTWVPILLAVVAGVGFAVVETRSAHPMLPMALFRDRAFTVPNVDSFVLAFGTTGVFILFSLFLQDVQHRSALAVGLLFVPLSGAICVVAPFGARMVARVGPYPVLVVGYLVSALGLFGLLTLGVHSGAVHISAFGVVLGVGMGLSIAPTQIAGVLAVPRQRSGLASACIATTRQAGTAIGVAVLGLIISTEAGRAGTPRYAHGFVAGLHVAGVIAGALTAAAALLTQLTMRRRTNQPPASSSTRPTVSDQDSAAERTRQNRE